MATTPVLSTRSISSPQEVATFNGAGSADMGWVGSRVDFSAGGQIAEENQAVREGTPRHTN
jgi:hypothetical protein